MRKIYTKSFKCSACGKVICEFSEKNRKRTLKSYTTVCLQCMNKVFCRKSEILKMLTKAMSGKLSIHKSDFADLVNFVS